MAREAVIIRQEAKVTSQKIGEILKNMQTGK